MNAPDFAGLCVPATCTLREALATLNRGGRGVLLVLHPDGRLRRTLTDGDLRRAGDQGDEARGLRIHVVDVMEKKRFEGGRPLGRSPLKLAMMGQESVL